jgi:glutathione S-transferase
VRHGLRRLGRQGLKLIIATPSPFARKVRIALLEKSLAHEVIVQNPWRTAVAANPLGKVPLLLLDDGRVVHDSRVIVEYLDTLGAPPPLLPADARLRVLHRQMEALADGICEAVVLVVTERARPAEKQSADWIARQAGKIAPALQALEQDLPSGFGLAHIAAGCALGYLDLRFPELDWRARHAKLRDLHEGLEGRSSFQASRPAAQDIRIG